MSRHAKGFDNRLHERTVAANAQEFLSRQYRMAARKMSRNALRHFFGAHVLVEFDLYYGGRRLPRRKKMTCLDAGVANKEARIAFCKKLDKDEGARLVEWKMVDTKKWRDIQNKFIDQYLGTGITTEPKIHQRKWTDEEFTKMLAWLEREGCEIGEVKQRKQEQDDD